MLGRSSPQGELFRPDNLYLDYVGPGTYYGFLAHMRHELFQDEDFAGLYRTDKGRPSVPPSQLCVALLLQARDGVSDEEAVQRTAFDLRWKVALGLDIDQKLCAKSTLQLFRAKLILNDAYQKLFEASIEACRSAGLLKQKKLEVAIDTTPVFGRGAVKDTFNLISDQIRRVLGEVSDLKGHELELLFLENGLSRHDGSRSFKGQVEIDWSDPGEKRALVGQLVADAKVALEISKSALRGYAGDDEKTRLLRESRDLLADLLLQDIEEKPEDGGDAQIRRGTSKDRIVSTTDVDMRHGRKSHSKNFDGYKATVVAETKSGVILATDARAGNVHDSDGAVDLIESATRASGEELCRVLGDTAYGSTETTREIEALGAELVAKAPPANVKGACYTLDKFKVDDKQGVATCPAGKKSIRRDQVKDPDGWRYMFSRTDCKACPLRSQCTTAKVTARSVTVSDHTVELQRRRKRQKTKTFKKKYRRRVIVEHRIGRLAQLGIRQARYMGRAKVAFQVNLLATVANLGLAIARAAHRLHLDLRCAGLLLKLLLSWWIEAPVAASANLLLQTCRVRGPKPNLEMGAFRPGL